MGEEGEADAIQISNMPVQVSPPERFNFANPVGWPQWKRRFERYMSVSGQNNKSDKDKIDMLLYIMGDEAEEILLQFAVQPVTYEDTVKKFESHFIPRRNVIFERFKFNSRIQKPGESVESFITGLHSMAEYCDYGDLKEQLIRDRIVVGMSDIKTSERLQLKDDLTLASCITIARQAELQSVQTEFLRHENSQVSQLSAVHQKTPPNQAKRADKCMFCALSSHPREKCPAKSSKCRYCSKLGHWEQACRLKTGKSVRNTESTREANEDYDVASGKTTADKCEYKPSSFLGSVFNLCSLNFTEKKPWLVDVSIFFKNKFISKETFLIDSGADITCLSPSSLNKKTLSQIKPCKDIICGPSGEKLNCLGNITLDLNYHNVHSKQIVYVIQNLRQPLLGRSSLLALGFSCSHNNGLASSVNNVSISISKGVERDFPGIFSNIGTFKSELEIKLRDGYVPYAQSAPRIVPIAYLDKLRSELDRLIQLEIIEPVEFYTPWVAPIVCVPKQDGSIRICGDYTELNKWVLRSYFPIPGVETTLGKLKGSLYFSKLDTQSGFYQIKLKKDSQPLTTFITPFGRFLYKRLPFGISCASDNFSEKFSTLLAGIEGVIVHVDDVLIYAKSEEEHDSILQEVLKRIHNEGITLNKEKCIFKVQTVTFLGHVISKTGISIDPRRIESITNFPKPTCKNELLQLLGMINYAGKYIPNKSQKLAPLTELLKNNSSFHWDTQQDCALRQIITDLTSAPCLAFFDGSKKIVVSSDASSFGLGAVLMLENSNGDRDIVAYASRLLSEAERRYAQIEKETLGLTWALEKFQEYTLGFPILLETDHKPLIQVLQTKQLNDLTPRLQRFRMRLMRYDYRVQFVPGKLLTIPDTLSRNPVGKEPQHPDELSREVELYVSCAIRALPVKDEFLSVIQAEQLKDKVCSGLIKYSQSFWPDKNRIPDFLWPYYQFRYDITVNEGLLTYKSRIIIPAQLQLKCLQYIHSGHQGIVKSRERAKMSVWWLGLSSQIERLVKNCPQCVENRTNIKEPFLKDNLPERPWQKIAVDLFKYKTWFLIITDYFSKYFEVFELSSLSEAAVILRMKETFSRFGIPEVVRSDNGPQFQSGFKNFAKQYNFEHVTSSPYFSQSNGAVEAAVKTAKNLIKKGDIYEALLSYRTTPLESGFSPAELLMKRKIRSLLPMLPSKLDEDVNLENFKIKQNLEKNKQVKSYNKRHNAKTLSDLEVGDSVWITDLRIYGQVAKLADEPRSYYIQTTNGTYRRNRWHLIPAPYAKFNKRFNLHESLLASETQKASSSETVLPNRNSDNTLESETQNIKTEPLPNAPSASETTKPSVQECSNQPPIRPVRECKKPVWMKDYVP